MTGRRKEQDICIANFKALMLLAIVVYHAWIAVRGSIYVRQVLLLDCISWLCSSLSYCLGCFFFVSGYFSYHAQENVCAFVKKKLKSIVVPYVVWNVIYILFFVAGALFLPVVRQRVTTLELNSVHGILGCIVGYPQPANGPLWYLRDIFILHLLSPVFYWILKKRPAGFLVILLICVFFIRLLPVSVYIILSFCLGMIFRIHRISLYCFCQYRKTCLASMLLLFGGTWIHYECPQGELVQMFLWEACHLLSIPACLCLLDKCCFSPKGLWYRWFTTPSFYIYASHGLVLSLIARTIVVGMPQCAWSSIIAFLFTVVLGVILILISYHMLRLFFPVVLNVLCGQRYEIMCKKGCYFQFDGSNGATFFFSAASFEDWRKSLEFYQGVSWIAKLKKCLLLFAYPYFRQKAAVGNGEVAAELLRVLPKGTKLTLCIHDSAMISPTRDKIVVHHHGSGYEKFFVRDSRAGGVRELESYRLLQKKRPESFRFSELLSADATDDLVHLQMAYVLKANGRGDHLPLTVFVDFFKTKMYPEISWDDYWNSLELPFDVPAVLRDGMTVRGTVHHDFKPWNVKQGGVPQIFDFEGVSAGLPLEDFFNFIVDPVLQFGSVRECRSVLVEHDIWNSAKELLRLWGISPMEVKRYWKWYLLERYDHFNRAGNPQLAGKFLALYQMKPPVAKTICRFLDVTMIAALAGAVRWFYAIHNPVESTDGITYMQMLRQSLTAGSDVSAIGRPSLYFYLTRLLYDAGMSVENAALAINLVAGSLLVIPVYLAGRALWRRHFPGLAAALFCAVMPKLVKYSCVRLRDGLYLFFVGWTIAFWSLAVRSERRWTGSAFSFLCGFAMAAGCMCRYEMLEFLPWVSLTLPVVALLARRDWRGMLLYPVAALSGFVFGIAGFSLLPGMPPVWHSYLDRLQAHFWSWGIWGTR
ncbi:MAG: acyltransferase family protein [Victivallaceae bacterium]|nr:acyltransferase family protein [Victivallaceae bacterium]